MTRYKRLSLLIIVALFILMILGSCRTHTTTSFPTYWFENPKGHMIINFDGSVEYSSTIETNDIKRLQRLVPFTILFPEYLPEYIDRNYPPALTMSHGQNSSEDVEINIAYTFTTTPNTHQIFITETNLMFTFGADEDMLNHFNVGKIKVYEEKQQGLSETDFRYTWNQENVGYDVLLCGYDQFECRKVIESIIK